MSSQISALERFGTAVDAARTWLGRTWRIAILLAKGAYIVNERRRLFVKLGEEAFARLSRGELKSPELEPLVVQLERLTKKVEIEEILIRNLRFGTRSGRSARQPSATGGPAEGTTSS